MVGSNPRFDSTYEGLKHVSVGRPTSQGEGFDSTYEGLKPALAMDAKADTYWFRQYL